tara:strand:- start:564 stop:1463 length:900 start_codon:yes stop_codon:yes gene_type:complete
MAAGGWFDWTTGDLVTESRFQDIQDSLVFIFSSESAANSALTNKVEGTIFYDTGADRIKAWNGSAWIAAELGDIEAVTTSSTSGLSGGGSSGSIALSIAPNQATTATPTTSDLLLIGDADDSNAVKKTTINNLPISSATQTALDNITAGTSTLTIAFDVKVADDGSGSQNVFYFLNGTDSGAGTRSPQMTLSTGFKYKFDVSDSSFSGHNLKFSTTADGSHGGGSEFTTNVTTSGTPGSANAFVQIEITPETLGIAGAVKTLYYYCSNHSGMGGSGSLSLYPAASSGGTSIGLVLALSG